MSLFRGSRRVLLAHDETGAQYIQKVQGYAPAAYWPLNEVVGTQAQDISGNAYHGTYVSVTVGGTTFVDGSPAPVFDGINDKVNMSTFAGRFSNTSTLSLWVKSDDAWEDPGFGQFIYDHNNPRYNFGDFDGDHTPKVYVTDAKYSFGHSLNDTAWHHFAIVNTPTAITMVVDGVAGTSVALSIPAQSPDDVMIGSRYSGDSAFWDGSIAHVAYFDRTLNATEIADLAAGS